MFLCIRDFTEFYHLSSYDIMYPIESSLVMRELSKILGPRTTRFLSQIRTESFIFCPITYSYLLRNLCYFEICDANRCEYEYAKMNSVCTTNCGNDSRRHRLSNFFLKLICNIIRHNITFDSRNIYEAAQIIVEHMNELDITRDDITDFLRCAFQNLHETGPRDVVNVIKLFRSFECTNIS